MFDLLPYNPYWDSRLDQFVKEQSVNGTFLQTRQFLNYHSARFKNASFALEKSGTIAVYFPGNVTADNSFISHQGATFGGPVFSKAFYKASRVLEILKQADEYFAEHYKSVRLKLTPQLFSRESPDLIEYALEHLGYKRSTELSAYTPLWGDDPLEHCDKECRRIFRQSQKFNVQYKAFENPSDFETFYKFLEISKAKHNAKPVHTLEELYDLQKRLNNDLDAHYRPLERIRFRGIWLQDRYVAGMMLFAFDETQTMHAQYIAPDDSFKEFQPTTCLYVNAMREAAAQGFKNFSWGISTENGGEYLNETLIRFKESLGAKASVNVTYTKEF